MGEPIELKNLQFELTTPLSPEKKDILDCLDEFYGGFWMGLIYSASCSSARKWYAEYYGVEWMEDYEIVFRNIKSNDKKELFVKFLSELDVYRKDSEWDEGRADLHCKFVKYMLESIFKVTETGVYYEKTKTGIKTLKKIIPKYFIANQVDECFLQYDDKIAKNKEEQKNKMILQEQQRKDRVDKSIKKVSKKKINGILVSSLYPNINTEYIDEFVKVLVVIQDQYEDETTQNKIFEKFLYEYFIFKKDNDLKKIFYFMVKEVLTNKYDESEAIDLLRSFVSKQLTTLFPNKKKNKEAMDRAMIYIKSELRELSGAKFIF